MLNTVDLLYIKLDIYILILEQNGGFEKSLRLLKLRHSSNILFCHSTTRFNKFRSKCITNNLFCN